MKKFIIALFTLLLFQNCCLAAYWKEFAYKSYIDLDTIEKKENGICKVWVKLLNDGDFKPINDKKIWYSLNTVYIDLKNKKYAIKDVFFYDLNNNNVSNISADTLKWDINIPDSLSEHLYNEVLDYPYVNNIKTEENWVKVNPDLEIDINSILLTNNECTNLKIKYNVQNEKLSDISRRTRYTKASLSVNLVKKQAAIISVAEYDKNNKLIRVKKNNGLNYRNVNEDTPVNDAINFIYALVDKLEKN